MHFSTRQLINFRALGEGACGQPILSWQASPHGDFGALKFLPVEGAECLSGGIFLFLGD